MTDVIDAHHHLIDPGRHRYPWLTDELAAIDRPFGVDDLAPELARAGVDRTIVVQALSSTVETRELLEIAAATPWIAGVVGWVDLTAPDVLAALEGLRAGPGGGMLVAIRHQVHDEPDADWLRRPDVEQGLRAIEAASLAYDLLVRTRELPAALAAARDHPGLRLVIDHLAKPPLREGGAAGLAAWGAALRPFGALPNVWGKLSGLVTEADASAWDVADLAPAVEVAFEIFGPGRLIFGSDWPVCLLAASYADVTSAARELTAALTREEQALVFGGTAARVYGLRPCPARLA
jgi:L-fucono-1,5-lactonase